ncbi:MAG TPA: bifunctional 4-hydroxy-2-oxoglutarate aldolase/2-dehydro-3-deoxy-phosphogluconate aldolase [Thermomicrobiales bacterium]|nr:bifunctional 4-hydroxy-2-oxoglutarate aldolase/2-dehydro-3-deoxy-phosphogluconate aldolase [Thermomicrobiales bacterium]
MTVLERILRDGVIAVVRLDDLSTATDITEALVTGGVTAVEFTFTNRRAGDAIASTREALGDRALIGAGSVLDSETARTAILAGAQYVVTPTFKASTLELCHRYGIPVVCGALTPTEILTAWEAGASLVKVHPASLGGPKYFKDVLAPMPQVKLVPSGGVTFDNVGEFIEAGAAAVALGSNLVDARTTQVRDWDTLRDRAQTLRNLVELARKRISSPR